MREMNNTVPTVARGTPRWHHLVIFCYLLFCCISRWICVLFGVLQNATIASPWTTWSTSTRQRSMRRKHTRWISVMMETGLCFLSSLGLPLQFNAITACTYRSSTLRSSISTCGLRKGSERGRGTRQKGWWLWSSSVCVTNSTPSIISPPLHLLRHLT
jgi:hypothetical protein